MHHVSSFFTDKFIRDLMLIIVLPLTLAVLFTAVVCIKVRPCCKPKPEKSEVRKLLIYSIYLLKLIKWAAVPYRKIQAVSPGFIYEFV